MDASKLKGTPDPEGDYVISTRIRVGRNIRWALVQCPSRSSRPPAVCGEMGPPSPILTPSCRLYRSGLGLSPGCSRAQRREVERIVVQGLSELEGDLKGK